MLNFDPRLCLVTDRGYCDAGEFFSRLEALLDAGVTWVQLREKRGWSDRQVWEWGLKIRKMTQVRGLPLIVDDRLDLAMALDADGVHLGQSDLPLQALRSSWTEGKHWGVSVTSLAEAAHAKACGATYLGFGALFPTPSKADAIEVDPTILNELVALGLPVIGIGGITPERVRTLKKSGYSGVAVISALWGALDPAGAVVEFQRAWRD